MIDKPKEGTQLTKPNLNFIGSKTFAIYLLSLACTISLVSDAYCAQGDDMIPNRLKQCPDRPNCVSSQAVRESQLIQPIKYQGTAEQAMAKLVSIIQELPNTHIVERNENYVHAEFQTKWLKFTDDVELLLDKNNKTIQVRSASRVGYSDFGTNRKRLERIKNLFDKNK